MSTDIESKPPNPEEVDPKELAKWFYVLGYSHGKDVEEISDISKKTAESKFQRIWDREV